MKRRESPKKHARRLAGLTAALLTGMVTPVSAAVPAAIPIQGVLTDSNGNALEGDITVSLALYRDISGGDAFFSEEKSLSVAGGVFTAYLGDTETLEMHEFRRGDVFVGISVGSDIEMSPLLRLASVPFAAYADYADDARSSVPVGGIISWWRPDPSFPIPDGYQVCDGSEVLDEASPYFGLSLPDLTGRFLRGVAAAEIGSMGGSATHTHSLSIANAGIHGHSASSSTVGGHTHTGSTNSAGSHGHTGTASSGGGHSHTASTGQAGGHSHSNSPTGSAGNHTHGASTSSTGSHSHSLPGSTGSVAWSGSNPGADAYYVRDDNQGWGSGVHLAVDGGSSSSEGQHRHDLGGATNSAGTHNHSVSINSAGNHSHTVPSTSTVPTHNHSVSIGSGGIHGHALTIMSGGTHSHTVSTVAAGGHDHDITVSNGGSHGHAGSSSSETHLPLYAGMLMLMRVR